MTYLTETYKPACDIRLIQILTDIYELFYQGALGGLVVLMYHEAPNTPPIRCDTTGDTGE